MIPKDALLEIGSEELPASFIPLGMKQLKSLAEESLTSHRLTFQSIKVYGTPHRLAIIIEGLAPHSPDQKQTVSGPPATMARDAEGKWTPAALGFARKQGVDPADLTIENGRLYAVLYQKGQVTRKLLGLLFPEWVKRLQFPKTMVWEPSQFRYPRPLRWLAALYGNDVVSFKLAGVSSGRYTHGLSIHATKKVVVSNAAKYIITLKNQCVLVDPEVRQDAIRKLADQAVKRSHGRAVLKEALLDQVSNLVEHPVAILGNFDPAYLDLPKEVLVICLEHHQKFFPVEHGGDNKKLLPFFIGIRNGMSVHQDIVREGYERVLAARLADARFFYNQDRKSPLVKKVDALKGVMFQETLGTLFDKKNRIIEICRQIAADLGNAAWLPHVERAANLCKADLVTDMVREFPELQGIMARLYALLDGEELIVANALEEHYWPITLTGPLPSSDVGAAVALADKLDTLAGDFAVGLIPTGSADPYGLRRAAVGVIRILENQKWSIPVEHLLHLALDRQPETVQKNRSQVETDLSRFLRQRFTALMEERGFKADEIEAILAQGLGKIPETLARLQAFHQIRGQADFIPLAAAFKRAGNIVRQAQQKGLGAAISQGDSLQPALLTDPSEQKLYDVLQTVYNQVNQDIQHHEYQKALESMVILREPLDQFFNGVMVMVDDPAVRANRLSLLSRIVQLFHHVGDFSKLQNA